MVDDSDSVGIVSNLSQGGQRRRKGEVQVLPLSRVVQGCCEAGAVVRFVKLVRLVEAGHHRPLLLLLLLEAC